MRISGIEQADLKKLLSGNFFQIPRFQRPFSWDKGNIEDFWLDCIEEGGPDYFIGSMVVYPEKNGLLAVVDGQQRLTTATLLLCALRDAFTSAGLTKQSMGVHGFVERPDVDSNPTYVLDTETSKPFLQEYIQKEGAAEIEAEDSEERDALQAAFDALEERVEERVEEAESGGGTQKQKTDRIRKELSAIRDQLLALRLIKVEVDNEDDAYVVFETLNTRGKDLELADMVKNHLLRMLGTKTTNVDPAKLKWNEIREQFDQSSARISINAFLHHSWLSRYPYVAENKTFKELRKKIRSNDAPGFLDTLRKEADLYRVIKEPGAKRWLKDDRPIARSLFALAEFGISQPLPLVLSILRAYDGKRISRRQCRRALWAIEAFHFSHGTVAQKSSSGGMSYLYARFARDLVNASKKPRRDRLLRDMRKELHDRRPTRTEFVEGFTRFRSSKEYTGDRRTVRYILDRHYRELSKKPVTDLSMMTVEHLAPQSGSRLDDEVVATIGNLIFVSTDLQQKLANKSFAEKQKVLAGQSDIWVPPAVASAKQWGRRGIEARSIAMAEESYDHVWRF
jgi:hypothetical protein